MFYKVFKKYILSFSKRNCLQIEREIENKTFFMIILSNKFINKFIFYYQNTYQHWVDTWKASEEGKAVPFFHSHSNKKCKQK